MQYDDLKIRDLSRTVTREWTPPISAMGGPPGHELYRDLVLHVGMRLLRDREGDPWVVLQDGEQRRAYRVPSPELVTALDRFRMRRNLRPAPERDIEEFTRTVQARVSDRDVQLPVFDPIDWPTEGPIPIMAPVHMAPPAPEPPTPFPPSPAAPPAWQQHLPVATLTPTSPTLSTSVSGGVMERALDEGDDVALPRYLRTLRGLVQHGDWLGSLTQLSDQLGEDSFTVYSSLIRYRSALAQSGVVIAPVETEEGWRWLAVDRSRVNAETGPSEFT